MGPGADTRRVARRLAAIVLGLLAAGALAAGAAVPDGRRPPSAVPAWARPLIAELFRPRVHAVAGIASLRPRGFTCFVLAGSPCGRPAVPRLIALR